MPKAGQTLRTIERVENASALAIDGRSLLRQLDDMLANIHRRKTPLSDYNLSTAQSDIAAVCSILWALQTELCAFRNGSGKDTDHEDFNRRLRSAADVV